MEWRIFIEKIKNELSHKSGRKFKIHNHKRLYYLMSAEDNVIKAEKENDQVRINIDYQATCNVPRTNNEDKNFPKAHHWKSNKQPTVALSIYEA